MQKSAQSSVHVPGERSKVSDICLLLFFGISKAAAAAVHESMICESTIAKSKDWPPNVSSTPTSMSTEVMKSEKPFAGLFYSPFETWQWQSRKNWYRIKSGASANENSNTDVQYVVQEWVRMFALVFAKPYPYLPWATGKKHSEYTVYLYHPLSLLWARTQVHVKWPTKTAEWVKSVCWSERVSAESRTVSSAMLNFLSGDLREEHAEAIL